MTMIFLIGMNLASIVRYELKETELKDSASSWNYNWKENPNREKLEEHLKPIESPTSLPDIYYIILDAYARGDILRDHYDYDNEEFLQHLRKKGFYVAEKSHSNYESTFFSLASSLNFTFLGDGHGQASDSSLGARALGKMIRNSLATEYLKKMGYVLVSFASGLNASEIRGADLYLTSGLGLSEFEHIFLNMTPLPWLRTWIDRLNLRGFRLSYNQYAAHRKQILYPFEQLPSIAEMDVPTFTFTHIMAPRHPYLFGPNGEERTPTNVLFSFVKGGSEKFPLEILKERYKDQLTFINKKTAEVIDQILEKSSRPPIIILQSDHGPSASNSLSWRWDQMTDEVLREKMSILNAYYLPDQDGAPPVYENITPVNTFRMILNHYFGSHFRLLEDRSFKMITESDDLGGEHVTHFMDVTKRLEGARDSLLSKPSAGL